MTEIESSVDDLLMSEEQANNLTYFAFAKENKAEPLLAPTKASIGALPDVLAGRYHLERLLLKMLRRGLWYTGTGCT